MAILHRASLSPTKAEVLAAWLPSQPWVGDAAGGIELVGAFRFDDPEGRVGMEVHLVRVGGEVVQVPLTYRGAPLDGSDAPLVATMEHSVLGPRWVYDGLGDPLFVRMLAAAALTGTGQAVGVVEAGGRWNVVPSAVRVAGGGWPHGPVAIDGFTPVASDDGWAVLRSERLELRVARRPLPGPPPAIGLTATWPGQDEPAVVAEVRDLGAP